MLDLAARAFILRKYETLRTRCRFQKSANPEFWKSRNPDFRNSRFSISRKFGIMESRKSAIPDFQKYGIPDVQKAGFPDKTSKWPGNASWQAHKWFSHWKNYKQRSLIGHEVCYPILPDGVPSFRASRGTAKKTCEKSNQTRVLGRSQYRIKW